jgi:HlyD family secretion protein
VDGTIELERLENVLYIGRPALGQEKSTVGIYRLENGGARASRLQVQIGRASVNAVEVLGGLSDGDQVILSDMSAWDGFDHLRIQ